VKEVELLDVDGNAKIMWKLFKDENDINEKAIVGFASFIIGISSIEKIKGSN